MAARDHLGPQFPVSTTPELYHGTTADRAAAIEREGFTTPATYMTPHRDLAMKYAEGRVRKEGGEPAVLRANPVTGVSAEHTGYSKPDLNRDAGADYMSGHSETIVLRPHLLTGMKRVD